MFGFSFLPGSQGRINEDNYKDKDGISGIPNYQRYNSGSD